MKTNPSIILIFILAFSVNSFSQFDSLIFKKEMSLDYLRQNIYALGDQNQDGFDDFLIYNCDEERAYIFFGGNPVDTIPDFYFDFHNPIQYPDKAGLYPVDINDDGIKDMFCIENGYPGINKIKIYYGGSTISSQPDLTFNAPGPKWNFGSGNVLKDFNNDGRSEIVIYNTELPNSSQYNGCFYFYNTGIVFDTIPYYVICGDTVDSVYYYPGGFGAGDLNGDGLTDFSFSGGKYENGVYRGFRRFYLGNAEWDLTPDAVYFKDEHLFDPVSMKLTEDLNKDGKADIVIHDYGFYPYYYLNAILYGSFPIDTIPDIGLNTQNEGINVGGIVELGDVNGDSFNDFMTSTYIFGYRNIKLWLGGRRIHELADRTWYGNSSGFCRTYGAVGDINGDGTDDIAIGLITYGEPTPDCNPGRFYIINGDTSVHADTVTSVNDYNPVPYGYEIFDPYPNPFNPTTTIRYDLPKDGLVQLKVFDILGNEVASLVNEQKVAGKYEVNFNASQLASGVYIYKIQAGDFISSKKMILIK